MEEVQTIGKCEKSLVAGCNVNGSNNIIITIVVADGSDTAHIEKILQQILNRIV